MTPIALLRSAMLLLLLATAACQSKGDASTTGNAAEVAEETSQSADAL